MKRRHMTLVATAVAALLLLLTFGASRALADSFTFQLTSDHCSGSGGCLGSATSAGTITITDGAAGVVHVDVTLNAGFRFVNTGQATGFGFNLTGSPTITYSGLTSGFTPNGGSLTQMPGSLHVDGTGFFQYGVQCIPSCGSGGSHPNPGPLDFTITATGLTTASFDQNAAGQFFVADLIGPTGNTGPVDASTKTPTVPDGGMTLILLGGALVALETLRRKFCV